MPNEHSKWTLSYIESKSVALKAFRERMARQRGGWALWVLVLVLVLAVAFAERSLRPLGMFVLGAALAAALTFARLEHSALLYADDRREISVTLDDKGLSAISAAQSWSLSWLVVTSTFVTPGFIFIVSSVRPPIPLPLSILKPETIAFIHQKARPSS